MKRNNIEKRYKKKIFIKFKKYKNNKQVKIFFKQIKITLILKKLKNYE